MNYYIDININYASLARNFIQHYYTTYDSSFQNLASLYKPTSKFTFSDKEYIGFNNLYADLSYNVGVTNYEHRCETYDAQPINRHEIFLTVTGTMRIVTHGVCSNYFKFVESFIISKDRINNRFFIRNTIFRVIN